MSGSDSKIQSSEESLRVSDLQSSLCSGGTLNFSVWPKLSEDALKFGQAWPILTRLNFAYTW